MAKAEKLPSESWNVVVFAGYDKDGKKIRKSFTAPTKSEAEYLAAEFKARHKEIVRDKSAVTLSEGILKTKRKPLTIKLMIFLQNFSRVNAFRKFFLDFCLEIALKNTIIYCKSRKNIAIFRNHKTQKNRIATGFLQ